MEDLVGDRNPRDESRWRPGAILQNRYIIESILGHGGMGVVFRIRHAATQQTFAVKTLRSALLADADLERMFIRELRTWMDLPDHPHLTPCLFFRTIEDRLAIFSEYVSGGSLKSWIRDGRIDSIETVLDVAIQIAWGLHAAHSVGVVHQDVKPANILLTDEGIVRLTDFGLSRACLAGGIDSTNLDAPDSTMISSRGMTIAYCSPEQAAGAPLTASTDIWSLGVSILEMILGEVTWPHGALAASVLEGCIEEPSESVIPITDGLAALLRRCFQKDPLNRFKTTLELADELIGLYSEILQREYPRIRPESHRLDPESSGITRRSLHGAEWKDPMEWIEKAYRRVSGGPSQPIAKPMARTRKTQILADLELYEEAARIYASAVVQPADDLIDEYSELMMTKGLVQTTARDLPGAVESYKEAVRVQDILVNRHNTTATRDEQARLCFNIALLNNQMNDNQEALEWNQRALDLWQKTPDVERDRSSLDDVAAGCQNRALILGDMQLNDEALMFMEKAAVIREAIVRDDPQPQFKLTLAVTCMNYANLLSHLGRKQDSIAQHCHAIELFEDVADATGREDLSWHLAMLIMNRGNVYSSIGEYDRALADYDRALAIKEPLVFDRGLTDQYHSLAVIYMNKASALFLKKNDLDGRRVAGAAIDIFERLVRREGRDDLVGNLIEVYDMLGASLEGAGESAAAKIIRDKAQAFRHSETDKASGGEA